MQQCSSDSSLFEVARSIFAIKSQISRLALPSGPAWRGRQSQHCSSHYRGNISGQILRITTPRPRHGLNYCWVSRYVDNISHGTDQGERPSMGWWANVIQETKSVFAQYLPWHISSCQPCPAPDHFFDLLIVRKTLFGALQVKKILWNYFYAFDYLTTMHFYLPVNLLDHIMWIKYRASCCQSKRKG